MKGRLFAAWAWYAGLWLGIGALGLFAGFGYALAAAVAAAVLPGVSLLGGVCARRGLSLALDFPAFAAKGQLFYGSVRVVNRSLLPAARVLCRVTARNELTGAQSERVVALSSAAHSEESGSVCLRSAYCGGVCVCVENAWVTDALGLIPVRVRAGTHTRLTVLPDSFAARMRIPPCAPDDADSVFYHPDRPGLDASEPFQLRPYRHGDDVRRIHWKLSSKLDETVVRDGSEPVVRRLLLFWDKTAAPSGVAMDTLAEAVVSVARALVESGAGCTLGWTGQDGAAFEMVDSVQALLDVMPMLLGAGDAAACVDGEYGGVLYFAAAEPKSLPPRAQLLLYSHTARDGALCFDETNCADVLRRLELL